MVRIAPVFYVPDLSMRLLSLGVFLRGGLQLNGNTECISLLQDGQEFLTFLPRWDGATIFIIRTYLGAKPSIRAANDRLATGPGRRTSRQLKRGGVYPCCEVFQRRTEDGGRTQRERDKGREDARTRQETRGENKKSARATRWKTRGDLLLCLGVARVHLIYRTLRNAEGTTPKLNHYPSEAPALRRSCASTLRVATFPYDVAMFLYDVATYLHDVLMLRTEGLDRFRGLPSYARLG